MWSLQVAQAAPTEVHTLLSSEESKLRRTTVTPHPADPRPDHTATIIDAFRELKGPPYLSIKSSPQSSPFAATTTTMSTKKNSTEGGTPTTTSWSTAGSSTGSQQQQQPPNRKPHTFSSTSGTLADQLLSPSSRYQSSFRNASSSSSSLTYSNSLRSNRTAAVSSHYSTTASPIKKTNSFSNLDSSSNFPLSTNTLPNSSVSKLSRTGMLTRPLTNHLKAPVKTARPLIVPKLSLENTPSSSKQESESVINKLSKRLISVQLSNKSSKTSSGTVSEAGAFTLSEPASSALPRSEDSIVPGCSYSSISDTLKELQIQSSLPPNLILRLSDTISNSSDDENFDELCQLEVNKCNITDDSDDSASNKSARSRLSVSKLDGLVSLSLHQSKQMNNNLPVNQSLPSPQSSHKINEQAINRGLLNMEKSIRNTSSVLPLRNCHFHRGSISSNDLMSSSNYVPSHRLLHSTSYNPSSSHCCHFRHHHHYYENHRLDSMIPTASMRTSQCSVPSQKNPYGQLGMSSIEATSIISSHCNTENNSSAASNAAAITKLTASSISGLPVSALTVMESPNLSSRIGSYNWQAFMPTLKDRMGTVFNCELLADVHFIVGKGSTRIPAHKFVLSIGSAVFDAMFNGPLTRAAQSDERSKHGETVSTTSSDDTEIELPDVEPEAFLSLLRFLYLDEVQIDAETVMATLYAAKKYEVTALEMACVDFLKANLNPDNAFMMLTQARLFDEATLIDMCLETIDKHAMDSLFSDSFIDIDLDTLKLVLNRDSLRVREVSLFMAAMRWAELECARRSWETTAENKRKVLGEALYMIRFPLMTIEEFAQFVAQSEVLTDKEVVNLFLFFTVNSKPSLPFSIEPRCCITGEECSVNRFRNNRPQARWGYSGTSDRIRFLTDCPIFVTGFGLFGSIAGVAEYEAVIEVIHTGSGKVVATNKTSFVSDGTESIFRVMFKYPVEITQNTNYTACATLKGVDSFYGTNGCRTVTVNLGKGDANRTVTFQFSYAAGCNNGTSVEDGQIPEILFYT